MPPRALLVIAVCALALPACDLLLAGEDCASDDDCSGDDLCDDGACVECENDRDCDDDEECDDGECERVDSGEGEGEIGEGEGEAGEGEGEGEGEQPRGLNQACLADGFNEPGNCAANLVCVPLSGSGGTGVCRLKCGDFEGASPDQVTNALRDGAVSCPGGTSCQVINTLPDGAFAAIACVERAAARDELCVSLFDDLFDAEFPSAACPAGLECQLTAVGDDAGGNQIFESFHCKQPCDPSASSCSFGEQCLPRSITFPPDIQLADDGVTEILCDNGAGAASAACIIGDAFACACDLGAGYECREFNLAAGGTGFFCNRDGFNCGVAVPPFLVANEAAGDLGDVDLLCNEVEDSRYCDPSVFDGTAVPAEQGTSICLGISATNSDGICFAFCGSPGFDANDDGDTADANDGVREDFLCGTGQQCTPALGLALGVVVPLDRPCDLASCTAGQPCPLECGVGDAYCAEDSTCVAPFFSCEPVTP